VKWQARSVLNARPWRYGRSRYWQAQERIDRRLARGRSTV
jgi:hypothetical protein